VAIPKNFHDEHYFLFPGTVWRAFEEGVLDKEFFKTATRRVVRFVARSPVAPNNPMPSPLPQIAFGKNMTVYQEYHELLHAA
jgi:hypothetical protein